MERDPEGSRLFAMQADAPTMTSQRIKSIATGNLATLVELGNPLGERINSDEDSFIYQAKKAGKYSGYAGDPVWK